MRALIAVLMMLWLPLQGFAASAMPFCGHAMHRAAAAHAAEHAHHSMHAAHSMHHDQQPPGEGARLHCDNCGACNLPCSPAVPAHTAAHQVLARYAYNDRVPAMRRLFIPEQPLPPPLITLARSIKL
jgi:hypothetical protein